MDTANTPWLVISEFLSIPEKIENLEFRVTGAIEVLG